MLLEIQLHYNQGINYLKANIKKFPFKEYFLEVE